MPDQLYDPDLDARLSYDVAVIAIGEMVRAGAPVPQFMLSGKTVPATHIGAGADADSRAAPAAPDQQRAATPSRRWWRFGR